MLWTVLLLAGAHTPGHFITECPAPDRPYHMHDVNLSQVHYIRLHAGCPVTFLQSGRDCYYETLSMGRFGTTPGTVVLQVDSHTSIMETTPLHIGIEPFTTTPSVKTHEIKETTYGCNVTISSSVDDIVYFVSGMAEDWYLFATIPWYAYKIQWHWAFAAPNWPIFWWPWVGYLVVFLLLRPTGEYLYYRGFALWMYMFAVDIMVPTIVSCVAVGTFPGDGFWVGVFSARLFVALWVFTWIAYMEWPTLRDSTQPARKLSRWESLGMFPLFLLTTGVGIGGYVLVPALLWDYS